MKLYEFEGKELMKNYGLSVPDFSIVKSLGDIHNPIGLNKLVLKAQLLTVNKRMEAGAIQICKDLTDIRNKAGMLLNTSINGEAISTLIIEEKVDIAAEYYVGIMYDTSRRMPVIIFTKSGGTGAEEQDAVKVHVNPLVGVHVWELYDTLKKSGVKKENILKLIEVIKRMYICFLEEDAKLVEVNPLAETSEGKFVAVDVTIELDDSAAFRHKYRTYSERNLKALTERERAVKRANEVDYKGTIKYIELDGDIGFLAAGGGGSMTCMDALIKCSGRPANYTEYSGNPSAEKVYELTKQIISKPNLRGLWIVGAIANFTRLDTTMQGIVNALVEVKPKFPIVVRRSGPFEKEGLEILKKAAEEHRLNMHIYGKELPMTQSAMLMVDHASKFRG